MFKAQHIVRSGTLQLEVPIDKAFPLFTPLGERDWVPGWDPTMLHPESGAAQLGTVFTTQASGEATTLWSIAAYDGEQHYVKYARVTPGSRFGWVEVACTAVAPSLTEVEVTYTFTGLSEPGNAYINAMTASAYQKQMADWKALIVAYLASGR